MGNLGGQPHDETLYVYLRVKAEQRVSHTSVTAPTAIAAIQAEMLVQKVNFVQYALAFLAELMEKGSRQP